MTTKFETISLVDLQPDTHNPRTHNDRGNAALRESLGHFGAARSIVVDKHNVVRAGNGTLEAARAAGLQKAIVIDAKGDELVVVRRSDWDEPTARAYSVADNRTNELSDWDEAEVANVLEELSGDLEAVAAMGFDERELAALGFGEGEQPDFGYLEEPQQAPGSSPVPTQAPTPGASLVSTQAPRASPVPTQAPGASPVPTQAPGASQEPLARVFLPPVVQQDLTPDLQAEPVTQPGDVWRLGRHKLVCGDCRDALPKLFGDEQFALLVTDPPYGIDRGKTAQAQSRIDGYYTRNEQEIASDGKDEALDLWPTAFAAIRTFARAGASFYVSSPQGFELSSRLGAALEANGFSIRQTLIWLKKHFVLGFADFHYKHEPLFYGWCGGAPHRYFGDRKQTSVWEIPKPIRSEQHPTMKPVELFARAIALSSLPDEIVADPFLGSGTTLIAAEQLGRICYGVEISPQYCDVIVKRWEQLTGERARRI